MLKILVTPFQV